MRDERSGATGGWSALVVRVWVGFGVKGNHFVDWITYAGRDGMPGECEDRMENKLVRRAEKI